MCAVLCCAVLCCVQCTVGMPNRPPARLFSLLRNRTPTLYYNRTYIYSRGLLLLLLLLLPLPLIAAAAGAGAGAAVFASFCFSFSSSCTCCRGSGSPHSSLRASGQPLHSSSKMYATASASREEEEDSNRPSVELPRRP